MVPTAVDAEVQWRALRFVGHRWQSASAETDFSASVAPLQTQSGQRRGWFSKQSEAAMVLLGSAVAQSERADEARAAFYFKIFTHTVGPLKGGQGIGGRQRISFRPFPMYYFPVSLSRETAGGNHGW
jgi:hypothetical protein